MQWSKCKTILQIITRFNQGVKIMRGGSRQRLNGLAISERFWAKSLTKLWPTPRSDGLRALGGVGAIRKRGRGGR